MNVILLAENKETIYDVYSEKILTKLNFSQVYTKEKVLENSSKFKDVQYVFSTWSMPVFTENEILNCFPNLKAVFYAAGTVKYFAIPFLKCGVRVYSAAQANGIPVAEFIVSQIILANKGYFQAQKEYKKLLSRGSFIKAKRYTSIRTGNYKAKIGLIGAGMVGTHVLELLRPFTLDVYVTDPFVSEEKLSKMGAKKVELQELFETCNVISNHLPDVHKTKGLLNYKLFSTMKHTATFINTGRGAQVVEKDLIQVLHEKPDICALLDVTFPEPLSIMSVFKRMNNVFITPHIAGSESMEKERLGAYMYESYQNLLSHKENSCEITLNMISGMA